MLASPTSTDNGQTLGTLSYMSPEQARGEDLDPRSDLFSFGVVLYEMATGREPFAGQHAGADLRRDPAPAAARRRASSIRTCPAELDHIVSKALEKDRDLRYQTAAELRADLKRLQAGDRQLDRSAAVPSAKTARGASGRRPDRRRSRRPDRRVGCGGRWSCSALLAAGYWLVLAAPRQAIDSVAVLPFVAAAQAADTEYLTDGITETLINGLAQLPTSASPRGAWCSATRAKTSIRSRSAAISTSRRSSPAGSPCAAIGSSSAPS